MKKESQMDENIKNKEGVIYSITREKQPERKEVNLTSNVFEEPILEEKEPVYEVISFKNKIKRKKSKEQTEKEQVKVDKEKSYKDKIIVGSIATNKKSKEIDEIKKEKEDKYIDCNSNNMSLKDWIITILLTFIPIVNIIMIIIWAVKGSPISKKNWARANLIFTAIGLLLVMLFAVIGVLGLLSYNNMNIKETTNQPISTQEESNNSYSSNSSGNLINNQAINTSDNNNKQKEIFIIEDDITGSVADKDKGIIVICVLDKYKNIINEGDIVVSEKITKDGYNRFVVDEIKNSNYTKKNNNYIEIYGSNLEKIDSYPI